jgi:hypothetical protein
MWSFTGWERREFYRPPALGISSAWVGFCVSHNSSGVPSIGWEKYRDIDFFTGISPTPDGDGHISLQDHVIVKDFR